MSLPETPGRRLALLRARDPYKVWWSMSELRRCRKCEALFPGSAIRLSEDDAGEIHFHCPTPGCAASWIDWEYPELHL